MIYITQFIPVVPAGGGTGHLDVISVLTTVIAWETSSLAIELKSTLLVAPDAVGSPEEDPFAIWIK